LANLSWAMSSGLKCPLGKNAGGNHPRGPPKSSQGAGRGLGGNTPRQAFLRGASKSKARQRIFDCAAGPRFSSGGRVPGPRRLAARSKSTCFRTRRSLGGKKRRTKEKRKKGENPNRGLGRAKSARVSSGGGPRPSCAEDNKGGGDATQRSEKLIRAAKATWRNGFYPPVRMSDQKLAPGVHEVKLGVPSHSIERPAVLVFSPRAPLGSATLLGEGFPFGLRRPPTPTHVIAKGFSKDLLGKWQREREKNGKRPSRALCHPKVRRFRQRARPKNEKTRWVHCAGKNGYKDSVSAIGFFS